MDINDIAGSIFRYIYDQLGCQTLKPNILWKQPTEFHRSLEKVKQSIVSTGLFEVRCTRGSDPFPVFQLGIITNPDCWSVLHLTYSSFQSRHQNNLFLYSAVVFEWESRDLEFSGINFSRKDLEDTLPSDLQLESFWPCQQEVSRCGKAWMSAFAGVGSGVRILHR